MKELDQIESIINGLESERDELADTACELRDVIEKLELELAECKDEIYTLVAENKELRKDILSLKTNDSYQIY